MVGSEPGGARGGDGPAIGDRAWACLEEEHRQAAEVWKQADSALLRALRDSRRREGQQDAEVPPPLRWAPAPDSNASTACTARGSSARTRSGAESGRDRAAKAGAHGARVAAARGSAMPHRAHLMRLRASDSRLSSAERGKRRLKSKIAQVLEDVQRRQRLQQHQERAHRWREEHGIKALGPAHGEATGAALGLAGARSDNCVMHATALVSALTLEELDLVRRDPGFFFDEGMSAVFFAGPADPAEASRAVDGMVDFFVPTRKAKTLPIEAYTRTIQRELVQPPQGQRADGAASPAGHSACGRGTPGGAARPPSPLQPLGRMPCQGRRPQVSDDQLSPTFAKVRVVYSRRCAEEARSEEERIEAIAQRNSLHAARAAEAGREQEVKRFARLEMQKMRAIQQSEKQAIGAAEAEKKMRAAIEAKRRRFIRANERAEEELEERRQKASSKLEDWDERVRRTEAERRYQEAENVRHGEMDWSDREAKLQELVRAKHDVLQENLEKDALWREAHAFLFAQLEAMRQKRATALAESIAAKQEAAAFRRHAKPWERPMAGTRSAPVLVVASTDPPGGAVPFAGEQSCPAG